MDFLDPKKRRAHRLRLLIGYGLMALAIGLGTVILVYDAYGYGINTKTGAIIQNGLLFVGSQPGGAQIYLDGQSQNATTSARLVLPAKLYQLTLKKDGYRDWQRQFTLNEHSIARYVYPLLLPAQPAPEAVREYSSSGGLVSQSPDRRWLLVQRPAEADNSISFDQIDTQNFSQTPQPISVPEDILTEPETKASLAEVEWSTDNRYLLVQRDYEKDSEFLVIDREQPQESFNVDRLFDANPAQVYFRDKQIQQFYLRSLEGNLSVGNREGGNLAPPFLRAVADFKPYGTRLVLYATTGDLPKGQAAIRIWDNGSGYELTRLTAGKQYLMDLAQFQGNWYYGTGSSSIDRFYIYKNPLDSLKNNQPAPAMLAPRLEAGQSLSFSANTRFIAAQAGQKMAVFDFEIGESFSYDIQPKLSASLKWMDGHRFIGQSGGQVFITDYDGTNQHLLVPSQLKTGAFFDRDFETMFVVAKSPKGVQLQAASLLAGEDLQQ